MNIITHKVTDNITVELFLLFKFYFRKTTKLFETLYLHTNEELTKDFLPYQLKVTYFSINKEICKYLSLVN